MFRTLLFSLLISLLPAKNFEIELPNLPHPVKVSLPDNFDPTKKHPAVFYYHGTNGRPNTSLIRHHAGEDNWIVVGMTYQQPGKFTLSEETLSKEISSYRHVRKLMIAKHAVDPARLYLAGFSKGGWHTNLMLQVEPTVSGGIIMGAGHLHIAPNPLKKYRTKKPVHIAVGRSDGNYPFALNAIIHHRKLGGNPTIEIWPNLGHDFPDNGSEPLTQWLKLRATSKEKLKPIAIQTLDRHLKKADALDPLAKWDRLSEIKRMPFYTLMSDEWKSALQTQIKQTESHPDIVTEAKLLKKHHRLLIQEINNNTLKNLREVHIAYLDLASQFTNTRQSKFLILDHERTGKLLKHFAEQEKLRPPPTKPPVEAPEAPDIRKNFPRNPLIK